MPTKLTQEQFIEQARAIHGDKYDYSKVEYINNHTKVTVICPKHGPFEVQPSVHKAGFNCPKCAAEAASIRNSMGKDTFVKRATEIHGDSYDYSEVVYKNSDTPVKIICPEHGAFTQRPAHHLKGCGCKRCGYNKFTGRNNPKYQRTQEEFEARAREIHGDRYDYSQFVYKGSGVKGTIICKAHGPFEQTPNSHLNQRQGCPKCNNNISKPEQEVFQYVRSLLAPEIQINQSNRTVIYPYELDIVIPKLKLAVEFNGTRWHCEDYKAQNYHQKKVDLCERKGWRLIQINEHTWNTNKEKVKLLLAAKLGQFKHKVYARNCEVTTISKQDADCLCKAAHMQGACRSSLRIGLYHEAKLVGVATFGRPRFNQNYTWEILRICFAPGYQVVGGASKMWKYFLRSYFKPGDSVITYANRYWSDGGVYKTLGFKLEDKGTPNYEWVHKTGSKEPLPRYKTQKHKLAKLLDHYDVGLTERENMQLAGYLRSYDAGSLRFTYS